MTRSDDAVPLARDATTRWRAQKAGHELDVPWARDATQQRAGHREARTTPQSVGAKGRNTRAGEARLSVGATKRLAMLASILHTVYVDPKKVVNEYLRRCKKNTWKSASTDDALKCFNLERLIDAETLGQPAPEALTLRDLIDEGKQTEQDVDIAENVEDEEV